MILSRKLKRVIPIKIRRKLKKRFYGEIRAAATVVDFLPSMFSRQAWRRALDPHRRPSTHLSYERMWSGFGQPAVEELEALKASPKAWRRTVAKAAWSLSHWYAFQGDYQTALDNLELLVRLRPKLRGNLPVQVMAVECLLRLDRPDAARHWLDPDIQGAVIPRTEAYLTAANLEYSLAKKHGLMLDRERLDWLNRTYQEQGFSPLQILDPSEPLSLDNIGNPEATAVESPLKLSVLVPAYNCADTLAIALASVLSQTWRNIEVIVVDDRSPDETWSVIQRFAEQDSRVVAIRHEQNGGAYAARNTALARATGDYVTVHDADDWSHPEKFAAQMHFVSENPGTFCTTVGVRVSRDLRFDVKANTGGMIIENMSSLLMPREWLTDLGGWDLTRAGADSELFERLQTKHRQLATRLFPKTPLTLILYSGSSLTQGKATGISTVNYGARRQYKEAYRHWHETERSKPQPDFRINAEERRFPAPRIMLGKRDALTDVDVLLLGDFSDEDNPYKEDVAQWRMLKSKGLSLALVHCPNYILSRALVAPAVRRAIAAGVVHNIVPGESVASRAMVVYGTDVVDMLPSPLPDISAETIHIIPSWLAGKPQLTPKRSEILRAFSPNAPVVGDWSSIGPKLAALKDAPSTQAT